MTLEQLNQKLDALKLDKERVEREIEDVTVEISRARVAAHPFKEGDVIKLASGDEAKVKRVFAGTEHVFMMVNRRLPSGRWSTKTSYQY